jgi:hypothetical protein
VASRGAALAKLRLATALKMDLRSGALFAVTAPGRLMAPLEKLRRFALVRLQSTCRCSHTHPRIPIASVVLSVVIREPLICSERADWSLGCGTDARSNEPRRATWAALG